MMLARSSPQPMQPLQIVPATGGIVIAAAACTPAGALSKAEIVRALEAGDARRLSSTDWDLSGVPRAAPTAERRG